MSSQKRHFAAHKSRVLAEVAAPGPDASPKGSVDVQILPLITRLNQHDRVFTTSSCSGRISVFLEGLKKNSNPGDSRMNQQESKVLDRGDTAGKAGIGGKGEGGEWLFVSHDQVDVERKSNQEVAETLFGNEKDGATAKTFSDDEGSRLGEDIVDFDISYTTRFVHLKFEPMILHIQTSDLPTAHAILTAALSAGFRESGIMNPGLGASSFPMVAVRCNGLAMDSIIGIIDSSNERIRKMVNDIYLKTLLKICNLRFEDNKRRIDAFDARVGVLLFGDGKEKAKACEDKEARKARKREEGLRKQRGLKTAQDLALQRTEEKYD